jgi:hypothetical protein
VQLTVTVELADDLIQKAAQDAFDNLLRRPQYGHGNPGYQLIEKQVLAYIAALDLQPMIDEYTQKTLRSIVAEVVAGEIARTVKADVKRRLQEGTLISLDGVSVHGSDTAPAENRD